MTEQENFLGKDYKIPTSGGNYMKFKQDENPFRILGSAITGFEYWNTDNKPVRSPEPITEIPHDIKKDKDGKPTPIKHFWAFPVWNYNDEAVQILEITQKSVMKDLKAYIDNKKWGDPKGYDFVVTRTGEGMDTEYSVISEPKSELDEKVKKAYEAKSINLKALYTGADPFAGGNPKELDETYPESIDPESVPF